MRFVLFCFNVESFNYFSGCIAEELQARGHSCFILDFNQLQGTGEHSFAAFTNFMRERVDAVIAFDGIGIKDPDYIGLWNSMHTKAFNILMDHPLRFHPSMRQHPADYVQICCDRNHVEYVKTYFSDQVQDVFFLPHAGTDLGEAVTDDFEQRPIDILFSGTYYRPQTYLDQIDRDFGDNDLLREFYHNLAEYMIENHALTTEQAVLDMVGQMELSVSPEQLKTMFACAEPIDWMARMHYREKVIRVIAEAGMDVRLLGRGWENHPVADLDHFHIISDRIPFAQTFSYMHQAKVNLNVMPWFKDGTHDRIFNVLLQGSLPFTDASGWLKENFKDGTEIAYYDLDHIERIPDLLRGYLSDPEKTKNVIRNGCRIVRQKFTWKNVADRIEEELVYR